MYNGTAYKIGADGKVISVEAVEIGDDGLVLRACGLWCAWNGRPQYDRIWRDAQFSGVTEIRIERDGAEGYRNRLRGLMLPPAYTAT